MNVRERQSEVRCFIQLCLAALEHRPVKHIAKATNLSTSTIYRLAKGRATLRTQINTVQALGEAAGFRLEFSKHKAHLRVVS